MFRLACKVALAASLALLPAAAWSQQQVRQANLTPAGFCALTLSGTAALISTCSGGVPTGARAALFRVDTSGGVARWRDDGVAPSSTVGMPISYGELPPVYYGDLRAIQFIAASSSPVLDISFYK